MRSVALLAALLPATLLSGWAQRAMSPGTSDEFVVQVTSDVSQSSSSLNPRVDFGVLSGDQVKGKRSARSSAAAYSANRRIQLRVSRKTVGSGRVTVQAYLLHDCYPCRIKFDGQDLGPNPVVVMSSVELNRVSDHQLQIEIPVSMSPGAIDAEIGWQVDEQ